MPNRASLSVIDGLFSPMTLFITYLLPLHAPRGFHWTTIPRLWEKPAVCPCALLMSVLSLHHPASHPPFFLKLVTSCTSKGIWFIRGATPLDVEKPSTCLSNLTFLATSIYFLFALSCGYAVIHPLAAGVIVHLRESRSAANVTLEGSWSGPWQWHGSVL